MSEIDKEKITSLYYSSKTTWAEFRGGGFLIGGDHYGHWKSGAMLRTEVEELVKLLQTILDDSK